MGPTRCSVQSSPPRRRCRGGSRSQAAGTPAIHDDTTNGIRGVFRTDDDARGVYSEAAGIGRACRRRSPSRRCRRSLGAGAWALDGGVPLIPRGSGSSMPSGAIGDGVIVDVSRWRSMSTVDVEARIDQRRTRRASRRSRSCGARARPSISGGSVERRVLHRRRNGGDERRRRALDALRIDAAHGCARSTASSPTGRAPRFAVERPWPSGIPAIDRFRVDRAVG